LKQWELAVADWTRASRHQTDIAFERLKPAGARSWWFGARNGGAGSMEDLDGTLVFTTTAVNGFSWDVQVFQDQLQLENGAEYVIRFKMKSSDSEAVEFMSSINEGDFHSVGVRTTIVPSPEFKAYEFTFVAHDVLPGKTRIGFDLGFSRGRVMVKQFVILKK
jgi:hypothetical protein